MRSEIPTLEALIAQHNLGRLKKVYKSRSALLIIMGIFLTAFACVWIMSTSSIVGNPLSLANQTPWQASAFPPSSEPTFSASFNVLDLVFPLFGLLFLAVGVNLIIKAILNQHVCAALCEYGVVYLGPDGADAFRWDQVATVLDKVNTHTNRTNQPDGFIGTSTTISHIYTVVCKDDRRFVFKGLLSKEDQLAEEIQIAIALHR